MTVSGFDGIDKHAEPEKSLTETLKKNSGRNSYGRITVRHRGGGNRRKYRIIDFRRDKLPSTILPSAVVPSAIAPTAILPSAAVPTTIFHRTSDESSFFPHNTITRRILTQLKCRILHLTKSITPFYVSWCNNFSSKIFIHTRFVCDIIL